jgi:hypothetical protein
MSCLSNSRSLPVQVRILLPVLQPEKTRELFELIQNNFPSVSCQLFILALTDSQNLNDHLEIRRNIQYLAENNLGSFYYDVVIKFNRHKDVILTTALQHRCDLVILSNHRHWTSPSVSLSKMISFLLRRVPVPVLLMPDPTRINLPFNKTLVYLNPDELSRLGTAFALRTTRLLSQNVVLTASVRSKNNADSFLKAVCDRYWPRNETDRCITRVISNRAGRLIENSVSCLNPDFLVVSLQDYPVLIRNKMLSSATSLIKKHSIPLLVVNRKDWVHEQEKKMIRIYDNLSEFDLVRRKDECKTDDFLSNISLKKPELFLGRYSHQGLIEAFQQYNLLRTLEHKGYPSPHITFDSLDGNRERLRVFPTSTESSEPLVDIILRIDNNPTFNSGSLRFPSFPGSCLYVEWLCLQDPNRSYRDLEIPLPGQKYPGLGIGWKVMIIIKLLAKRIGSGAIYNMPEYYHTARLYHRFFRYADPLLEGRLQAIDRDTFPLHLVDTSWAFLHGLVLQNDSAADWLPGPQILPLHPQLIKFFNSEAYADQTRKALKEEQFTLDLSGLRAMMNSRKLYIEPGSIFKETFNGK